MPPKKRYADMTPEEKAARRRQMDKEREERMKARLKGRTMEQYQQDRKKKMEEWKREREKDWTKDPDFKECFKQFLRSHSNVSIC